MQETVVWKRFHVGVDLGQRRDYTAIAVVEQAEVLGAEMDRVTWEYPREMRNSVRFLERLKLGTTYPEVVRRVRDIVLSWELYGRATVMMDATGVGAPVVDLFRGMELGCGLVPVIITGGEKATQEGGVWRVPKRELISGLEVMFQEERLRIAKKMELAGTLVKELLALEARLSRTGHESFGVWREGEHDDLVLAVALACWRVQGRMHIGMGTRRLVW